MHAYATFEEERLPGGGTLTKINRAGFHSTLLSVAVPCGGVDSATPAGSLPDGAAHFLEHCMVSGGRPSLFEFAARHGAMVEAETSPHYTTYNIRITKRSERLVRGLLEAIAAPRFTRATVEKERLIIATEIAMRLADPWRRARDRMVANLFAGTALTRTTLGTLDSLNEITLAQLCECHRTFYSPSGWHVCVVGADAGEPADAVRAFVQRAARPAEGTARSFEPPAQTGLSAPEVEGAGVLFLGVRQHGEPTLGHHLAAQLVMKAAFEPSSRVRRCLEQAGFDGTLVWGHTVGPAYGYLWLGGYVEDARKAAAELIAVWPTIGEGDGHLVKKHRDAIRARLLTDWADLDRVAAHVHQLRPLQGGAREWMALLEQAAPDDPANLFASCFPVGGLVAAIAS